MTIQSDIAGPCLWKVPFGLMCSSIPSYLVARLHDQAFEEFPSVILQTFKSKCNHSIQSEFIRKETFVIKKSQRLPRSRRTLRLCHRAKLEYMLVCGSGTSGGFLCMWPSSGRERVQWCAVDFTAPLLNLQFKTERRWRNTDLRQMMKTQGSMMGFRA